MLLSTFYAIHPLTLIITTVNTMVSSALPALIFRPLSPSHDPHSQLTRRWPIRNRPILTDPYTTIATSLLATAIFAVLLELAFATFLPAFMITHFAGIRTLTSAHLGASGLPSLLAALLPTGWACMEFLFAPATAATAKTAPLNFVPQTSGFWEHVYWNVWGWYSARQKELIFRAVILGVLMAIETVVFAASSLKGVELVGALGYAGVWAGGVAVLAGVLDWVGGPSD